MINLNTGYYENGLIVDSRLMILKEYFSHETNISKELKIYRSFQENSIEEKYTEKALVEKPPKEKRKHRRIRIGRRRRRTDERSIDDPSLGLFWIVYHSIYSDVFHTSYDPFGSTTLEKISCCLLTEIY